MEIAALVLDIKPGDEVICPSFAFVSTASAFALRGAKLVFADSLSENPNVDVEDIVRKITPETKAIVVVHYAGVPVENLMNLKQRTSIPIVEDCAHAVGSTTPVVPSLNSQEGDAKGSSDYVGKIGCMSTFSFHETKNLGIGEGGMLVVNDSEAALWEKARICREKGTNRFTFLEGRVEFYEWQELGSSYLMSDVNAGILWGHLQHYDEIQQKRAFIWDYYAKHLWPSTLFQKPLSSEKSKANAHAYYLQFYDCVARQKFEVHERT